MITFLRELLASLSQPSSATQTPEIALIRGLAHVVLGAALGLFLPPVWALLFYSAKEANDLRQGGRLRDGLFDLAFVSVGLFQPFGWPVWAILIALLQGHLIWREQRA